MALAKVVPAKEVACPACKAKCVMRVNRSGVWQTLVMAPMGIYPWKCGACGITFLFRNRGYRGLPPGQARSERRSQRAA